MKEIVVAVEVGPAIMAAAAASKTPDGKLNLLAVETCDTPKDAVRNGLIVKPNDVAGCLPKLLRCLTNRLGASVQITGFYTSLACRSLTTVRVGVPRVLDSSEAITSEILSQMRTEALAQLPSGYEPHGILSESYALDGDDTDNPIGAIGGYLLGTFAVACARPDCAGTVRRCVALLNDYKMYDCLLAPQMAAEAVTSPADREAGCAVVDFGIGCTSVAVYTHGALAHVAVIPLGGWHITSDLMSLGLSEKEAESLKPLFGKKFGSEPKKNEKLKFPADAAGNERVLEIERIQHVCRARIDEIMAYVMQHVAQAADPDTLAAGLVVTGGLAQMEHAAEIVAASSKMQARVGSYADCVAGDSETSCSNASAQLIGLLLAAADNCVEERKAEQPAKNKKHGKSLLSAMKNKLGDLFSEENMGE